MNDILKKEAVIRVQKAINDFDKNLKIQILNDTARTASDAAKALNCNVGAIVKSLLLKTDHEFVLCLVSGDKKCSLNKVKKLTGKKDVCMANAEDVKSQTGFTIGGVSPIGHLNKINVHIDNSLKRFDDLYAAAGHPNCVFKINFAKLQKITNGLINDITE